MIGKELYQKSTEEFKQGILEIVAKYGQANVMVTKYCLCITKGLEEEIFNSTELNEKNKEFKASLQTYLNNREKTEKRCTIGNPEKRLQTRFNFDILKAITDSEGRLTSISDIIESKIDNYLKENYNLE